MAESIQHIDLGYTPRPLQAHLHQNLERFNVLVCHRRFGKCLDVTTPIPTPTGYVPIGELVAGDEVLDHKGEPTRVIQAHEPFVADTWDVVFDSGISVNCDSEHLWYVEPELRTLSRTKREPWKCGENIPTHEMIERFNRGERLFIPVSKAEFPERGLSIDPYWLGLWLGDGSKDYPSIYSAEPDDIPTAYTVTAMSPKEGCYNLYYGKQGLRGKLRELDLLDNKHIPEHYIFSSREQRLELLRGLMDSDGSVSSSGTCVFYNKNKELLDGVVELLRSLGIKAYLHFYREDEGTILFTAPSEPVFKLQRKQSKVRAVNYSRLRHKIVAIIPREKRLVRCIAIDSPNKLFLATKSYVATHNTVFSLMHMIAKGLSCTLRNPQYAYIAPTYGQAKRVAWDYMKEFTANIPNRVVNEADLRVDVKFPHPDVRGRVRFMLLGSDNPDSLRGIYLDGAILDEYAQCAPELWGEVIRPALSDRKGWAIFIGTPKGQNHFFTIYEKARGLSDWHTAIYRADETGIVDDEELEAAKATMTEDEYNQEYLCDFSAALQGAYYSKYMNELEKKGQICAVPYDRNVPVYTFWDLGISDTTAIWYIQMVGREIHVIDYTENAGVGLEWYVKEVKGKEYVYEEHWIPHDGAARELGTGVTRQETLRNLGLATKIVPRQSIADGINAVRLLLPRCWFDTLLTKQGVKALRNYQRKWDSKNNMFVDKPLHDWSSNAADAFRMLALIMGGNYSPREKKDLPRSCSMNYNPLA